MDIGEAFDEVVRIATTAENVNTGMTALLDYSETTYPSPIWAALRSVDYRQDAAGVTAWLRQVLESEPPSADIKAYWFGIYNPVVDDEESRGLYVTGSTSPYSAEDADWACWQDDSYIPENRYAPSPALHKIFQAISQDDNLIPFAEFTLILGYSALAVTEAIRSALPALFFGQSTTSTGTRQVGLGFDDGDYLFLGTITASGFERPKT